MPLYLIATPIGNLNDMSRRALDILHLVDMVLCENPRHSQKLLSHYDINKKTIPFHDHNEKTISKHIIKDLKNNKNIALISDSGTPLISDPGFFLVRAAISAGIKIVPIPGASAILMALLGSGLPMHHFSFFGFPPIKQQARNEFWQKTNQANIGSAVIFLPPHKAEKYLQELVAINPKRLTCLAREMTKIHEEYITLPVAELLADCRLKDNWRGEMVLVLAESYAPHQLDIAKELLNLYRQKKISMRDGLKKTMALTHISKNNLYELALHIWKKK
ncbi:MAG: 16S rRNA (cytidine(1402)-2'-O)-methyltransferase [Alphaproteobacteria bacterium]